jgi:hypothetical protein
MIDRDTLRTARRTVERNGYTVLPPRDKDERDLNRYRTRREVEKEDNRDYRPARPAPRFRDTIEDEQPRRFKPLRQREYDKEDYEPRRTSRPAPRREMNDDEKLGAAIRTAEENGFTIRKMSKLDQAKQVARDNGFEVRRADDDSPRRPTRRPVETTADGGNDRPARTVPGRAQRPLVRPKANPNVNDGIRTRTAPDTEIKGNVNNTSTQTQEPSKSEPPKNPTYADDFMDRAARFFGENE